jgi:hypothetical protein
MKNKKINEGPVTGPTPKKKTSTTPASNKSWMPSQVTTSWDTVKTQAAKADPGRRPAKGAIPDIEPDGYVAKTAEFIGRHPLAAGIVAVLMMAAATGPGRRVLGRLTGLKKLSSTKWVQMVSKWNKNRIMDNFILRIHEAEAKGQISRRLAWELKRNPEKQVAYLRQIGAISDDLSKEMMYLLTHGSMEFTATLEIEAARATIRLYKKGSPYVTWESVKAAASWLSPEELARLKKAVDALKVSKRGKPVPKISATAVRAITKQELNTWANTPIGQKLAPGYTSGLRPAVSPVKLHPTDLTQFAITAKKYPVLAAAFYGKTKEQFYKLTTHSPKAHWDTWLIHDGWDTYEKIAKASQLPSSFKLISEWPSFTDWEMAMRVHNLHPNIWKDAASMKKQYLKDKFLWLMSK